MQGSKQPERILLVRLSAIGDVIHGLPVLCALRRKFPDAFLGWVVEQHASELLEDHPALDALIRVPRGWMKSPRAMLRLRHALRQHQFDTSVDVQCLTKSAVAARLSGAPRRIGVAGPNGRELSKWFHNELIDVRASHVIDHYLQLLRPLGIESPLVEFRLPESTAAAQYVEMFLSGAHLKPSEFVLLNSGAGWRSKLWPAERYGELAKRIYTQFGFRSLVAWGGNSERQQAQAICDHGGKATALAPPTSLPQLAALCRRARLCVGSDTGPLHLAVAVGAPCISLHGTTRANWSGAYGPHNIQLQAYYQNGTARQRRQADDSAMRAISVNMVEAAAVTMLSRKPDSGMSNVEQGMPKAEVA